MTAPGAALETWTRDLAVRVAGANHSRRLYGAKGQAWQRTLHGVVEALQGVFDEGVHEITVALLADGLAVQGVPVADPPSAVLRFVGQLKARDVEIVSLSPGVDGADLEALFTYLGGAAADVAGVKADTWLSERGVDRIRIRHLRLVAGEGVESFRDVYFRGRRVLQQQFAKAKAEGGVQTGAIAELARALVEVVLGSEAPLATLLALKDRDDFLMVHAVNVASLVAAQAHTLGLDEDDVQGMVSAALTHDIGKMRVPEAVLRPGGALSADARAALAKHTLEGARLLQEGFSRAALGPVVARFHHDPPLPGTPGLLAIELCRIADVFDGVRSLRPFDAPAGMAGALGFMARRMGARFNPYLLARFARLCGVGPAGARGWLSTGEIVQVLEPHPELAFHPRVRVLDAGEGTLPPGAERDLRDDFAGARFVPKLERAFRDLRPDHVDDLG